MSDTIYINGRYYKPQSAKISVFDRGFLYGDAVFETMRSYDGVIFLVEKHLIRLSQSAAIIRLKPPHTSEQLVKMLYRTLKNSKIKNAYIRLSITRGIIAHGSASHHISRPNTIIICREVTPPSDEKYKNGVTAVISTYTKTAPNAFDPRIKSHNYLANILARMEAAEKNAYESLLTDSDGFVTEGAMSNFFLVKNNALYTPPKNSGILEGT
ncbi:MAG: aminotransferase class IV, partial [bacterium]